MLSLESMELVHGIITDLLQLLLVLIVDLALNFLPFVSGHFRLILWFSPVSLLWSFLDSHLW